MKSGFDFTELKKVRDAFGFTLEDISGVTGISTSVLNQLERGFLKTVLDDIKRKKLEDFVRKTRQVVKKIEKLKETIIV